MTLGNDIKDEMGKIAASLRQQKETEKDDAKKVRGMYSLSLWALGGTATNLGLEYDDIGSLRLMFRGERHCVFVAVCALGLPPDFPQE